METRGVVAFALSVASLLAEGALQVSGYQNPYVAAVLALLAFGFAVYAISLWIKGKIPQHLTPARRKRHLAYSLVLIVISALGLCVGGLWYYQLLRPTVGAAATPPPNYATQSAEAVALEREKRRYRPDELEFHMLMILEFPNMGSTGSSRVEKGEFGKHKFVEFFVVWNKQFNTEFYVVYIPPRTNALGVCRYVLENHQKLRDEVSISDEQVEKLKASPIWDKIANKPLPFTGRIFIYHESPLTDEQVNELVRAYKEKELAVEFRGPKHVAEMRKKGSGFFVKAKEK